jgi:hypothetical protein
MPSALAFVGEAFFWIWTLMDGVATFVLGLAGFQQDEEEGTTLPGWIGWTAMLLVFIAVGVLIYAINR